MTRIRVYWILLLTTSILIRIQAAFQEENYRVTRNGLISRKTRWTKFFIYVDPEYDNYERALIKEASSELQEILPCVKFWVWPKGRAPLKYKETFIHVMKSGNGCSSHVGKKPSGSQKMKLDSKCMKLGTIIHEMIHALGFHHEQSRPDRDDYVEVNFDNIREGKQNNFKKYDYNEVSTFGVPYNPKSIMQYSSKAFSANGEPTILTINGKRISNSKRLQKTDIIKLKRMYKC